MLSLNPKAVGYLQALDSRFKTTSELLAPLPTTLRAVIDTQLPLATPHEKEAAVSSLLWARNNEIRRQSRQINIDIRLLHAFEGEMNAFHDLHI